MHGEGRAAAGRWLIEDVAPVALQNAPADGQPQAVTADSRGFRLAATEKTLEDMRLVARANARSVIDDKHGPA